MMNWDAISAIGEMIGATAVVVSLVYLAVQIRQNTRSVRGSALDAIATRQHEELRWSASLANEMLKMLHDPDSLTEAEGWRLSEFMTAALTARQNEYYQYRQGLLDEEIWGASISVIQVLVGIGWTQRWWREYGRDNFGESFVALVDELIAGEARNVGAEMEKVLAGSPKEPAEKGQGV